MKNTKANIIKLLETMAENKWKCYESYEPTKDTQIDRATALEGYMTCKQVIEMMKDNEYFETICSIYFD